MVLRVVAGQAAREVPGGLPPAGASSFFSARYERALASCG